MFRTEMEKRVEEMVALEETLFGLGGGLIFGYVAGKAFKFVAKAAAIVIGVFVLVMMYLSYKGWISANWDTIETQTKQMAYNATTQAANMINEAASKLQDHSMTTAATPIAGGIGFIIGLGLGIKH